MEGEGGEQRGGRWREKHSVCMSACVCVFDSLNSPYSELRQELTMLAAGTGSGEAGTPGALSWKEF